VTFLRSRLATLRDLVSRARRLFGPTERPEADLTVDSTTGLFHAPTEEFFEQLTGLAGNVAHDFKAALSIILGESDLLLSRLAIDDPIREGIEGIRQAALQAGDMANGLTTFTGRSMNDRVVVDINDFARATQHELDLLLGDTVTLTMALNTQPCLARADREGLRQILLNLSRNAQEAMPQGGRLAIATSVIAGDDAKPFAPVYLRDKRYVVVEVSDTGIGMDSQTLERMFEPFFTTKARSIGTGLGLSTVWGIVNRYKGHILVDSKLGEGTTIRLLLPHAFSWLDATDINAIDTAATGTETVLLVDDEPAVRHVSAYSLSRLGYAVVEATDSRAAVEMLASDNAAFDLVITDMTMPGISGAEVVRAAFATRADIAVLCMSGFTYSETALPTPENGRCAFLKKPFTRRELANAVRAVLEAKAECSVRPSHTLPG
jgi:two-component system, cell cycle sensor histidine kinase and response regulator CckA